MHERRGVIFDVDGVLVDSYTAHWRSWQQLGAETGVPFTEVEFQAGFGRTSREVISEHWRSQNLTSDDVSRMDERKEALYRQLVEADFPAMEGAADLIEQLRDAGFALAVGSSGPRQNIDLVLRKIHLLDAFETVVSGEDVTRGKPDPQVFLVAAERLKVAPARCIVIEDAPAGVAAAHAARMTAVALLSRGRSKPDFRNDPPDLFATTLRQLSPQILRELLVAAQDSTP
jgi:beta-phosphoglucomutase